MRQPAIYRFVSKIRLAESGCWEWMGRLKGHNIKNARGRYSQFAADGYKSGHRWSYFYFKGPIPDGLTIDHLCRNTICVNPEHLEAVSMKENVLRGIGPSAINHKKTHCINGHKFTPDNIRVRKDGRKNCLICKRAIDRKHKQKLRDMEKGKC